MKNSKNCTCGRSQKVYCPQCSKVRMVILLKNGFDHHKKKVGNREYNPVWYSFLKYNPKDVHAIAKKMEENLRKHPEYSQAANVLQFYINGNRHNYFHKVTL